MENMTFFVLHHMYVYIYESMTGFRYIVSSFFVVTAIKKFSFLVKLLVKFWTPLLKFVIQIVHDGISTLFFFHLFFPFLPVVRRMCKTVLRECGHFWFNGCLHSVRLGRSFLIVDGHFLFFFLSLTFFSRRNNIDKDNEDRLPLRAAVRSKVA